MIETGARSGAQGARAPEVRVGVLVLGVGGRGSRVGGRGSGVGGRGSGVGGNCRMAERISYNR